MKQFFIFCFFILAHSLFSQNTQTIRGVVIDGDIKTGLPYANVYILDSLSIGTSTNSIGEFELNNVPIGRHLLGISYTGYKTIRLPIQFLLICVFFLLYDIELIFLFPFVSGITFLGMYDILLISLFFLLLFFSLIFDFNRHALLWQY